MNDQSNQPTSLQQETPIDAPALPAPPRPLTPRVRRRSWAELPVRVWLILAALLLAVTLYFTITRVREAVSDRWLLTNGLDVSAKFLVVDNDPVPKRRPRNQTMAAKITYSVQGRTFEQDIQLESKPDAFAMVKSSEYDLKLKVDPNDPTHWTEAAQPKSWAQELTVVFVLAPLAIFLILITWLKRRGVLRTWREGSLEPGVVVEVRDAAIAPKSRLVRFSLTQSDDRRVHSVLMPAAAGIPKAGEPIWLLCTPGNAARAIAASLYE